MGKRIVDEEMRFTVIINGNKAQKELYDLEKSTKSYTDANKVLRAEKAKLQAAGKKDSEAYRNLTAEIKKNNKTITANKTRMAALQKQIGITGLTMGQLKKQSTLLRMQLHNMVPGSAQYKKLELDLKAVSARMSQLKVNARATEGSLSKLAGGFNKYALLGASVIAMLSGMVLSLQKVVDFNGKLSDSMSNVQKTTGMTKKEVDDLAKSFGVLKTRTTRINLLSIAEQGGRIGIVKEEIAGFVEVMNKANVALGDSFTGGVEEVSSKLGKLKFLFKETKDLGIDEAYNSIGSALNELGASGNSTEANITEFTLRLGALPDALKPSITETLALGATFEESGVQAEIAARAYSIFITKAAKDSDKFAKVMGVSTEQVKDMINTDPLKFFLEFSKGLQGMDATDVAKTLDYLGTNATGVQKALGAAANNSKRFAEQQILANKAAAEGTSLLKEYEIKNNNFAAILDKVGKRIRGVFASDVVVKGLTNLVGWFAKFIGASEDATGGVTRFKNALIFLLKTILIISTAILSYTAALKLADLWTNGLTKSTKLYVLIQKINVVTTRIATATTLLLKGAFYLLTGQLKKAAIAMRALSIITKLSPWGILLGAIAAVTTAYIVFSKKAEIAATKQSMLNDAFAHAQEKTAGLVAKVKALQEVVEDETASEEARLSAVKELNKIVPDYNKNLDLSKTALEKGKTAVDLYVESLIKQAEAQFLADQIAVKSRELMEQQNTSSEKHIEWYDKLWGQVKSLGNYQLYLLNTQNKGEERKAALIKKTKAEIEAATKAYKDYIKLNPNSIVTEEDFTSNFVVPTGDDADSNSKGNKDNTLDILRKNLDLKNQLIQDDFERERAILFTNSQQKITDLREQLVDEANLKGVALAKAKFKNQAINDQILLEAQIFQDKQETLALKYIDRDLKNLTSKYEQEAKIRRAAFELELAQMDISEEERKAKQDKYDQAELISRSEHTQEVIDKVKEIMASEEFEGIDLEFLSDEQKAALEKKLTDLGLKLSDIKKILASIKNGGNEEGGGVTNDLDVFGYTVDQWEEAFTNLDDLEGKLNAAAMGVQGLMNTYQFLYDIQSQNEQRRFAEFDKYNTLQRDKLKQRLDAGIINQRQYDAALKALDRQKAEMEYQAAKRAHKNNVTQAIGNTALAVINGLMTQPVWLGIAMGALMGVLGGIQVAAIKQNAPVKGYETGYGYGKFPVEREQDGKIFNASYGGAPKSGMVNDPTILVGEMPELIITNPDLKKFNPEVTQSLSNELARIRGFETGKDSVSLPNPTQVSGNTDSILLPIVSRAVVVLEKLEDTGVIAFLSRDMENTQKLKEDLKKLDKYREKSAI